MNEEDRIIASFSDAELILWHQRYGTERLSRRQVARLLVLLEERRREAATVAAA